MSIITPFVYSLLPQNSMKSEALCIYPLIYLKELKKINVNISRDSRRRGRDLNQNLAIKSKNAKSS
jgi:hypothetical protein